MLESRQVGTSLWRRPQKNLLQGDPVLQDRSRGAFSLILSLEQAKKVSKIIYYNNFSHRNAKSYSDLKTKEYVVLNYN